MNTDLTDAEHITDLRDLNPADTVTALSPDLLTKISGPVVRTDMFPQRAGYIGQSNWGIDHMLKTGWTIFRTKKAGPELPVEDGWYFSESRGVVLLLSGSKTWHEAGKRYVSLNVMPGYLPLTKMEPREQTLREVVGYLDSEGWNLIVTLVKKRFGLDVK